MSLYPSSPPQSTIDMSLWLTNTATNTLLHLISEMETKMISDIHMLYNERKIKHKHKNIHIQPSHLLYNFEILMQNFQVNFKAELSNLIKNNKSTLTVNMNKIKLNPQPFMTALRSPKQVNNPSKSILQISNHHQIYQQLRNIQNDVVFIDTETDGISTHNSNLLSICLTTIDLKENPIASPNHTEHLFYIKPSNEYTINTNSDAFKINQISQSTLDTKGSELSQVAPIILKLLTTRIAVGFNINSFDIPIIRNNLKRINTTLPPLMTIDLYQAHYKLFKHDLNSALKHLKCYPIPKNDQHSANADTDACIRLLAAFTKELNLPSTKETYLTQCLTRNKHQIFQINI
jgi:uncharacterized protein YprB with RNaseH-like and TPR domain